VQPVYGSFEWEEMAESGIEYFAESWWPLNISQTQVKALRVRYEEIDSKPACGQQENIGHFHVKNEDPPISD
jgi:hypothetical protein